MGLRLEGRAGKDELCFGREMDREAEREMGGRLWYSWNGFLASVINASFVLISYLRSTTISVEP